MKETDAKCSFKYLDLDLDLELDNDNDSPSGDQESNSVSRLKVGLPLTIPFLLSLNPETNMFV